MFDESRDKSYERIPSGNAMPVNVFLNVPYDKRNEPLFITYIGTLVCLGLKPRCTLEVPEKGQGRLARIQEILESCASSIHDLSRVGVPVRFNMPFELGLACGLAKYKPKHEIIVFESIAHRMDRTLSDYKGPDPYVHNGSANKLVGCLLDAFITGGSNPLPVTIHGVNRLLRTTAQEIKKRYGKGDIYHRTTYLAMVSVATDLAAAENLIRP